MASLLDAGIDIHSAVQQSVIGAKGSFRKPFLAVSESIKQGSTLSKAIRLYPKIFPPFDSGLIETGEQAGLLPESFKALVKWYAFKEKIYKQIMSNLWYPLFLIHAAPVIMNIPGLFGGMSLSRYFMTVVFTLMIFYIPCGIIIYTNLRAQTSKTLKQITDRILNVVPVLGKAMFDMGLGRFTYIFWAVYKTGMSMEACMALATKNCGNTMVKAMVEPGIRKVQKGMSVSSGFSRQLPHDFRNVWAVGEESGSLEGTTLRLARQKFESAEDNIKLFAKLFARTIEVCSFIYCAYWIFSKSPV